MTKKRIKTTIAILLSLIIMSGDVAIICASKALAYVGSENARYSSEYKVYPQGGPFSLKEDCKWELMFSSDRSIAKPKLGGKVKPGKIGDAEIMIYDVLTGESEKVRVKVARKQRIALSPRRINASYGDDKISLKLRTNSDEGNKITYRSGDEKVATVDQNGHVEIKGAGKTRLTASAEASASFHEAKVSIPVKVSKKTQSLEAEKKEYSICITDMTIVIKTKSDTKNEISFRSEDEKIAKVKEDGTIEPVALGETKIQIIQKGSTNYSEAKKTVKITIREPNSQERIQAAIEWAKMIAADNDFTYGGDRKIAWKGAGCYFCGTTKRKVELGGPRYAKTYTCMPFVTAAYAHGAQDPEMLRICQAKNSLSLTDENFERFSCWHLVGRCNQLSMSDLKPGDVLCDYSADNQHGHLCMYIGDDQIAEASGASWSAESITVRSGAAKRLSYYSRKSKNYVMRYDID